MDLDLVHLRTLAVVLAEGTLEAAAERLHVTPSAVSQRLRALEGSVGRVLLVRSRPVQATPSGEVLVRLARQVDLLTTETMAELGGAGPGADPKPVLPVPMPTVPLAVNADSLGLWVLPALAMIASEVCVDLRRADESQTAGLLHDGTVVAALTTRAEPVPGCTSSRLGRMRYRPVAAPGFAARWFPSGPTAAQLAAAPVVVFDREDDLQDTYLRTASASTTARVDPPRHHVPSSADFRTAVHLGMGWGMLPERECDAGVDAGLLVDLDREAFVDVVLHWQQWKLRSAVLDRVAATVHTAARQALRP